MPPKVSINLCCYNGEKYLEETLQSIFSQTYKDWELVIVNDGSSDSTEKIIEKHRAHGWPVMYHYQENAGLSNARNKALQLSHGEYIAFIDQDDIWFAEKLEQQLPLFDDANVGFVFSDAIYFTDRGKQMRLYQKRKVYAGHVFRQLLANYYLCLSTVVVARRALDGAGGGFDEQFQISEEADLFGRIAYSWCGQYVPKPLVKYRIHAESASWRRRELIPKEMEAIIIKYKTFIPDFESKFSSELSQMRAWIQYEYAKCEFLKGNLSSTRKYLAPIVFCNLRFAALFLLACLPKVLSQYLLGITSIIPTR